MADSTEETIIFSQFFCKVFGNFQRVWKSLEKLEKSLEKLFQTLFARNYHFIAIINSIIFPARVEIHETRFVAGTFTQPSERPVIFQKNLVIFTFSKLFFKLFPKLFPKLRSPKYAAFRHVCSMSTRLQPDFTCPWQSCRSSSPGTCSRACHAQSPP